VRLSPLGTSATIWPIVPAPDDDECGEVGGMSKRESFFCNPSLFAICIKYNKQMEGNRNKLGGRELSSAHKVKVK
jgi:hypothetical protein